MSALATDLNTEKRGQLLREYEVAAAVDILYVGAAGVANSDGYAAPATATSGDRFLGIVTERCDNSAGSAGTKKAKIAAWTSAKWAGSGFTQGSVGAEVWFSDDQTVSTTAGVCFAGVIEEYVSTTSVWVNHIPAYALQAQLAVGLAGASTTTRNAFEIDVTDVTTNTGGYQRGLYISHTATGDKTSTAEINGIGVDLTLTGSDVPYAYCIAAYVSQSGNPTIGQIAGLSIYLDDPGSACTHITAIDIGLAGGSNSPSDRHTFIRCRNHTAGQPPVAVMQLEGNPVSDYLFSFQYDNGNPVDNGTGASSSCTGHIAVRMGNVATTKYIRLYESTS